MKILMISSYYLPYLAGAELYVKEIAERLVRDGNKVAVLTKSLGKLPSHEIINGVKVYRIKAVNASHARSPSAFPGMLSKGIKMARQADIVHAHIAYPNGILAYVIKKATGKEYILTLQGDELMDYPEKRLLKLLKWPIKIALRNASKVHCISNALAKKAVDYFNVDNGKIVVIANGVDIAKFNDAEKIKISNDKKRIVMTVSRLTRKNNVEILLRAMKHVKKARLIVIGDGPEKKALVKMKKELGIDAEFLGNIKHSNLPGYLKNADVFVRTPITEGLGIVFLEAMAAGVPIIASSTGGINDIVKDNVNGVIVSNKNAREIAYAINKLLDDKKLRAWLIENGRRFVKEYDWQIVYEKTKELYAI